MTAQAPHRLPFLFFAEHRSDIVQVLAICRLSPFNGRVASPVYSIRIMVLADSTDFRKVHIVVHNNFDLYVLSETYSAVRALQVIESTC